MPTAFASTIRNLDRSAPVADQPKKSSGQRKFQLGIINLITPR